MVTKLINIYNAIITYLFVPTPTERKSKVLSQLPRSRKRWTIAETNEMIDLFNNHLPISQIACELDRTESAIRSKLISLGYSSKGDN